MLHIERFSKIRHSAEDADIKIRRPEENALDLIYAQAAPRALVTYCRLRCIFGRGYPDRPRSRSTHQGGSQPPEAIIRSVQGMVMNNNYTTQKKICKALNLLTPRRARDKSKIRIGGQRDGGYVMIDHLAPNAGAAYSLGVGPDTTWDVDMGLLGWRVFQYDHTVDVAPNQHVNCIFHKIGLAKDDTDINLKRLDTLMRNNGHLNTSGNILKIDIEGNEWDVLDALAFGFFNHFSQIVAELHWLDHLHDDKFRSKFERVIGNINSTHHCVHVHANNYAGIDWSTGISISPVLEVTFINRDLVELERNEETFPTILDVPNDPNRPDIYLGRFSFPWVTMSNLGDRR